MFITKKHLSRRTVLRGMGAAVALPLLDVDGAGADAAARRRRRRRRAASSCIEMVHGSRRQHPVRHRQALVDARRPTGADFEFTTILKPLEPFREYLTVVTQTDLRARRSVVAPNEEGADHFRSSAVFLTAAHPKQTEGSDIRSGHVDRPALRAAATARTRRCRRSSWASRTSIQSGTCGFNYSCVYLGTISWSSPTTPLPMTHRSAHGVREPVRRRRHAGRIARRGRTRQPQHPRRHHARSRPAAARPRRAATAAGSTTTSRTSARSSGASRRSSYNNASGAERELPAAPIGVPDSWEEHVKLMFDLQVLAFVAEVTRVSSFKMSRDTSNRVFPESGFKTPFHSTSHHGRCASRHRGLRQAQHATT